MSVRLRQLCLLPVPYCAARARLELKLFLPPLPAARIFRCVSPHLALISFLSDKITLLMSKALEMLKT